MGNKLLSGIKRVYLSAISWFDAIFIDSALEDEALLVEPNGDWLRVGYE